MDRLRHSDSSETLRRSQSQTEVATLEPRLESQIGTTNLSLKSQVGLLQTAHSWANAGVLLGGRVCRGGGELFETRKLSG